MSTYGKVCLGLTIVGLLAIAYCLPLVGKIHNEWSAQISAAQETTDKAIEAHRKQTQELETLRNELTRAQIGWDKSWNISPSANTGVLIQGSRLVVAGLGSQLGLVPIQYEDEAGDTSVSAPAVHAFKVMPEGGLWYVGEFIAEMQQGQIAPTAVTLIPTWQVTPDEVLGWASNPQGGWRFRTLMPAAPRLQIDQLNGQLTRLNELYLEIDANFTQQDDLLQQAENQLKTRQGELLGNPDVEATPGRPELSDGLLSTIKSEEERRNDLQLKVDELRREIRADAEERDGILQRLDELMQELPSAKTEDYATQDTRRSVN